MRITSKFTLGFAAGIILVHALSAAVRVQREQRHFEVDSARDAKALGHALSDAAARIGLSANQDEAAGWVESTTDQHGHLTVRWIWLDGSGPPPASLGREHLQALGRDEQVTIHHRGDRGGVHTYTAVRDGATLVAAIEVADASADERAYLHNSIRNSVIAAVALVLLSTAVAWVLGRAFVGTPVALLVEHARRVGSGDLTHRLLWRRNDEFGELASEYNRMVDGLVAARAGEKAETEARLAAMDQLRHADRLKTVGTLASGIAHELGTPLNVVRGHAQMIDEDSRADRDLRDNARVIIRQTERMAAIIRQVLNFGRRSSPSGAVSHVSEIALQSLRLVEPLARKHDVTTELHHPDRPTIARIGAEQLQQVLTNLMMNAIQAMPNGGTLTVDVAADAELGQGSITVQDEGVGIPSEELERIFEPFVTTKHVGEGTGLGLSVAHGIVKDHGGHIDVVSAPGQGSRFTVRLPLEAES